jgi:hypothetical protein
MILVRFMNLKFLRRTRGKAGRNFKFTALAPVARFIARPAAMTKRARGGLEQCPAI